MVLYRRNRSALAALALAAACLCLCLPARAYAVDTITMYRLYNPYSGEHLYTNSAGERDNLVKLGWASEGVGWFAPASSNSPVYRLYNPYSGDHHYTLSKSEYDTLGALGWSREGTGWYSDDAKGQALYRVFNPYVTIGTHHYTDSQDEYNSLGRVGWVQEGVAWYGVANKGVMDKANAIMDEIASDAKGKSSTGDKLSTVAERVQSYAATANFTRSGEHYNKPVGLLAYGQCSCEGTARTVEEILRRMGYSPRVVNDHTGGHYWCEVTVDNVVWIVEGEGGFAARKSDTANYPNGKVTSARGETFEFRAS